MATQGLLTPEDAKVSGYEKRKAAYESAKGYQVAIHDGKTGNTRLEFAGDKRYENSDQFKQDSANAVTEIDGIRNTKAAGRGLATAEFNQKADISQQTLRGQRDPRFRQGFGENMLSEQAAKGAEANLRESNADKLEGFARDDEMTEAERKSKIAKWNASPSTKADAAAAAALGKMLPTDGSPIPPDVWITYKKGMNALPSFKGMFDKPAPKVPASALAMLKKDPKNMKKHFINKYGQAAYDAATKTK